jgi:hypothetical protein
MNENQQPIDIQAVNLLKSVQSFLANAINSLGGTTTEGAATYLVWGAIHAKGTSRNRVF